MTEGKNDYQNSEKFEERSLSNLEDFQFQNSQVAGDETIQ
jgi:hypothetical protein